MKLIYLASPFTHKSKWIMKLRWAIITALGAKLVSLGYHIFGPITESHAYDEFGVGQHGWDFWQAHDHLMIEKCDELWVVKMKGWKESLGVNAEIAYALSQDKQVFYIDPEEYLPELNEVF